MTTLDGQQTNPPRPGPLFWWEHTISPEQRVVYERLEREYEERLRTPHPLPRTPEYLAETLAAYKEPATQDEYTRMNHQYYLVGVTMALEWALGIRKLSPIYNEARPENAVYANDGADEDMVGAERKNAYEQMSGREKSTGRPMGFYRGVENACSWLLGEDMWLDPPQEQPNFRWTRARTAA